MVLISADERRWDVPAGRPEGDETWEETLRREVLEEACATVHPHRRLVETGETLDALTLTGAIRSTTWRALVEAGVIS